MTPFHESMTEYRKQMERGVIQEAYKGLMSYIMSLRTHLQKKYPNHHVSGSIYYGYMDMTYFSFFTESLKQHKLKVGIVFLHESVRFEVWLFGINKQVQKKYWKLFQEDEWDKYPLVATIQGADSIIEHILVDNPDFRDLDDLTEQIEEGTLKFIKDVEGFLSKHKT